MSLRIGATFSSLFLVLAGCSSGGGGGGAGGSGAIAGTAGGAQGGAGGASGGSAGLGGMGGAPCPTDSSVFETGDPDGHADPYGARAAGQARAGRLTDAAQLVQPAHGRQPIEVGDFVLANDRIAVVIEAPGASDGYAARGGEIVVVDRVGDDGRPAGVSNYLESLLGLSIEVVNPTSVTVMNDGSDGNAAVVRATGPLERVPFLDGSPLGFAFATVFGQQAAYDYVLEPGSERLVVRFGVINPSETPIDASADENYGFFHANKNDLATEGLGFGGPSGMTSWVGWVSGDWNFAVRPAGGQPVNFVLEVSGVQLFSGTGFQIPGCSTTWRDHAEVLAGGPELDGLLEAMRRVDGETPWREITGRVEDASGNPVADVWVHELDASGSYLSRTRTDASGDFVIHAPDQTVTLAPHARGYPLHSGTDVDASTGTVTLTFGPTATLEVSATDSVSSAPLPVRVQVIPTAGFEATPDAYGQPDELNGRLHQAFATSGNTTLTVPVGEHRVVVSRGYEYEIVDTTLTVAAGETATVDAVLERSVDTTNYLCADFHIHADMSVDSKDPIEHKLASAVADGLDIPVLSEHEWVRSFEETVAALGLEQWTFGMASEELTTFHWGHFGVVPMTPRPGEVNNGAIDWIGRNPPEVFDAIRALPEDPVLVINHPSGGDFGSYFSTAQFDVGVGAGTDPTLWSTNFDAIEVFNETDFEGNRDASVAHWFALLNAGDTFWAVGSSDSHFVRTTPIGYPRTCLEFGHDDPQRLTPVGVRDVLGTGRSTISGGLFMTVQGPGGELPGETIATGAATVDFVVTVAAPSWVDATELEVIVDGATQETQALAPMGGGTGQRFVNVVTVPVDALSSRSWVVFHAQGDQDLSPLHPNRQPFAVSNPIFITPP